MPNDPCVPIIKDALRERLADTESIILRRSELTKMWRTAETKLLALAWTADPSSADPGEGADRTDLVATLLRPGKTRTSAGRLMQLELSLLEVGIHCERPLARLDSPTATVRIYRKWRTLKSD
ncbi:hypothetical protein [Streptomyces sp. NBC_01465]|uniref:hypothetical protein n=1 Tax=Streptomyces sp. NBC_01465 TaxID=2903878 RepID=UPI002E34B235|nr:hypothetical protein [Streptomyces sp. NBC_01465]